MSLVKTQPAALEERPASIMGPPQRAPTAGHAGLPVLARAVRRRLINVWAPQLSWTLARSGRTGLLGMALLAASGVFYLSTGRQVADEVRRLRLDLDAARAQAAAPPAAADFAESPQSARSLPSRDDVPQLLKVFLRQADAAQLSIDTAKYEVNAAKTGSLVRYRLSFPVNGPYIKVRQFLDSTLTELPELAIDELSITRKSVADQTVEAQLRMTIFTRGAP
jgi:hypothetical protein